MLAHQEVSDEDRTDRRKCRVEEAQPAHEVVVQPQRAHRTENARDESHGAGAHARDVRKAQAGGIQGIVVGRPNIRAEHENRRNRETLGDHDVENVILAGERAAHRTEAEHEGVAKEERDHRRDDGNLRRASKAREVRGRRAARNEGTHDHPDAGHDRHRAATEHLDETAGLAGCRDHRVRAEDRDKRNGNEGDDLDRFHPEVGGSRHGGAGGDHDPPGADVEEVGDGDTKHRHPHAEPSHLGQAHEGGGQKRAATAEGAAGEEVKPHAGLRPKVGEATGVDREHEPAERRGPYEAAKIETVADLRADAHGGGEEGKSEHHESHGPKTVARGCGNWGEAEVGVVAACFARGRPRGRHCGLVD